MTRIIVRLTMTWRQHKLHLTWRSHFRRSLSLPLSQVPGRCCPLSEDSYRIPLPHRDVVSA